MSIKTNLDLNLDCKIKVAALCITFNQKDFVEKSLLSLFDQTYKTFDIVISDDCSTDGTFEVLQELVLNYKGHHKIILNRNLKNHGIGKNTQIAIDLCKADLYVTCDGDDISTKDRFSQIVNFFKEDKTGINFLATDAFLMTRNGVIGPIKVSANLDSIGSVLNALDSRPIFFGATTAFTKDLIDGYPQIQDGVSGIDQIMLLRSLMKGGAKTLHKPLIYHREGGVTGFQSKNIYEKINRLKVVSVSSIADSSQMILDSSSTIFAKILYQKLNKNLVTAKFINEVFSEKSSSQKIKLFFIYSDVSIFKRIRFFSYAMFTPYLNVLWILKRHLKKSKAI